MQQDARHPMLFIPLLVVAFFVGCHAKQPPIGLGDDWRAMTQHEKQMFVSGYLVGNGYGTSDLCKGMDDHVVTLKMKDDVAASDRTCTHFASAYTHGDQRAFGTWHYVDPYVATLDAFYEHAECSAMPYSAIMEHLNDAEYKSGDDLYRFVRSGDARLGFFSGFDGIEKCYGVDRKR
jgi:hypothetical protein